MNRQLITVTAPWLPAMLGGLCQIADGLITVLTFGVVTADFSGRWAWSRFGVR